ncbi:PREDICTED: granzyme A-like [Gavialis gangeticus]|uniref:granzyme A-like n=1 Tax=Gavialis gangeticus TaxID=94835 RepID=UPI00092E6D54|nr:PREDICTED: granzyme A-like [Gavialis gangeticus]
MTVMMGRLLLLLFSVIAVHLPLRYGCIKIIGGHTVAPHSRPFMAAIQKGRSTVYGGALIEKNLILTAAHCKLMGRSELKVVLGVHQPSIAEKEQQIFKVLRHCSNPQFNSSSKENDIMLLKLNGSANVNQYVALLPLPSCDEDIKAGTKCQVAGWGLTSSGKPSKYLKEATVKVINRKTCSRNYKKQIKITNNMLCAGWNNAFSKSDACQGDSGGPLICSGKYSGIISFGKGCGKMCKPGVYTRLTEKYLHWIKKIIDNY